MAKHSLALLVVLILSPIVYLLHLRRTKHAAEWRNGCAPPPRHADKDPFIGLDLKFNTAADMLLVYRKMQTIGHTFASTPLLSGRRIYTCHPDNIGYVLKHAKSWGVQPQRLPAMEEAYGRSFITMDGEVMLHHKKLIKPFLSGTHPDNFSTFVSLLEKFIDEIPTDGTSVDLQPRIFRVFYGSALNFVLGVDPVRGAEGAPCTVEEFEEAWIATMTGLGMRIMMPVVAAVMPKTKYHEGRQRFHAFIDHFVKRAIDHQKSMSDQTKRSESGHVRNSMVLDLARENSDPMFLRAIASQTLLGINATTSWLVSNVLFLLARRPDLWAQVRQEALDVGDRISEPDALLSSSLYRNVLQETLRLYPLFPFVGRTALNDTTLPAGGGPEGTSPIAISKGDYFHASIYALHHDSKVFGEDVETFDPSRWERMKPREFEFLPFGAGSRACMGQQKALLETTYMIAQMARRFERLESRDEREWKGVMRATCRNANGCVVAVYE